MSVDGDVAVVVVAAGFVVVAIVTYVVRSLLLFLSLLSSVLSMWLML